MKLKIIIVFLLIFSGCKNENLKNKVNKQINYIYYEDILEEFDNVELLNVNYYDKKNIKTVNSHICSIELFLEINYNSKLKGYYDESDSYELIPISENIMVKKINKNIFKLYIKDTIKEKDIMIVYDVYRVSTTKKFITENGTKLDTVKKIGLFQKTDYF